MSNRPPHRQEGISRHFNKLSRLTSRLVIGCVFSLGPSSLHATNCSPDSIVVSSQSAIDNFQTWYGPCDTVVGRLKISRGPISLPPEDITNVNGLAGLVSIGELEVYWLNFLTDLDGLSGLETINGDLIVDRVKELTNIDGLSNVSQVAGSIYIGSNPKLTRIEGLSGLAGLASGFLSVYANPQLISLKGLEGFTATTLALNIRMNDSLIDLHGLENITHVGGDLRIRTHANLKSLRGLSNIRSVVGNVTLEENPLLSTCNALFHLLDDVDDELPGPGPGGEGIPDLGQALVITGNAEGCNSRSEVLQSGPPPFFYDGFE